MDNVSLKTAGRAEGDRRHPGPGQRTSSFDAKLGPAPDVEGTIAPPQLEHVTMKLAPTALAPLAPFLAAVDGAAALREVLAGTIETDLDLETGPGRPCRVAKAPPFCAASWPWPG